MIPLSHLIDHYQKDLESIHGHRCCPATIRPCVR